MEQRFSKGYVRLKQNSKLFLELLKGLKVPLVFMACAFLLITSKDKPHSPVKAKTPDPINIEEAKAHPESLAKESPEEDVKPLTKTEILNDKDNLISDEFSIPTILQKRTGFWLDIYTKYGSNHHVIHHNKYPWIVFKVVDTTDIANSDRHKWTRYHQAKNKVKKEKKKIANALRALIKRRSYRNLKGEQKLVYASLAPLRGHRKAVFRTALKNIRAQLGQKDFFMSALRSSKVYLPYMESIFENAGLPTELTRIPFVESSFNLKAYSKVGAAGIWQIMPRTAKERMHVSQKIDERMSPYKSTIHATKHIKRDFRILKSWPLAVNAYNLGVGNMRSLIKKYKTRSITKLISRANTRSFRFAAKNFYPSFLAALYAEKYQKHLVPAVEGVEPIDVKSLKVKRTIKAQELVKYLGVPKKVFLNHNFELTKALKHNYSLPKNFLVFVPKEFVNKNYESLSKSRSLKITGDTKAAEPKG